MTDVHPRSIQEKVAERQRLERENREALIDTFVKVNICEAAVQLAAALIAADAPGAEAMEVKKPWDERSLWKEITGNSTPYKKVLRWKIVHQRREASYGFLGAFSETIYRNIYLLEDGTIMDVRFDNTVRYYRGDDIYRVLRTSASIIDVHDGLRNLKRNHCSTWPLRLFGKIPHDVMKILQSAPYT